jgi:phage terminase large subunit-like protein
VLAADRRQARNVLDYITGFLDAIPMLGRLVERRTAEAIHLRNRIVVEVHTASFRAVRGYTVVGAVCDEIAFWRAEDSANPDVEILNGIRPGMATVANALLLCISSPMRAEEPCGRRAGRTTAGMAIPCSCGRRPRSP